MYNPEEYLKHVSTFQKRDAEDCLNKYGTKMKWKNNARIIDLGTGDGSTLNNLLKKYIPADYKEIIGTDISVKMVNFAIANYADENTKFRVMDTAGDLPEDFKGRFDHAFSSYSINFIPNQEKVFKNIYDLLVPGGTCLMVFTGFHPLLDVFTELFKKVKWQPWAENAKHVVPRYHYMTPKETEEEILKMANKARWTNVEVKCADVEYVYDNVDKVRKMMEASNLCNIPEELNGEFTKEFMELGVKLMDIDKDTGKVTKKYRRVEFFGIK